MTQDQAIIAITATIIVLDIITGILKAYITGTLSSKKMREGLIHKSTYAVIMTMGKLLEYGETQIDLGYNAPLFGPICAYIIITEITSILENITEINPELKNSKIIQLIYREPDHEKKEKETE